MSIFRDDFLNGKVALVTGGGSGICKEISKSLGKHGAKIVLVGRREEVLKETSKEFESEGIEVSYVSGDVRDPKSCENAIKHAVEKFSGIDILINGAAGNFLCPAEKLSYGGFSAVIDIDLKGTFNMCRASYETLSKSSAPVILNISATLHYQGTMYQSHVMSAKAAIDALARNLAVEWAKDKIRVVGIAPGPIGDTEGMKRLAPGKKADELASRIPLRRLGRKEDIANAALFLVSDAACYITGETLIVDGGEWLYKQEWVPRADLDKLLESSKS